MFRIGNIIKVLSLYFCKEKSPVLILQTHLTQIIVSLLNLLPACCPLISPNGFIWPET